MNIFEQLESAEFMIISNSNITTNFGWNADDEPEDWCLSIYGLDPESMQNYEYYLNTEDMNNATKSGRGWMIAGTFFEFCTIAYVDDIPTRRDGLVAAAIDVRDRRNAIIRESCVDNDPIKHEILQIEIKHMQNHVNELETEIQLIDYPKGM